MAVKTNGKGAVAEAPKAPEANEAATEKKKVVRKPKSDWGTRDAEGHVTPKLKWGPTEKSPIDGFNPIYNNPLVRKDFETTADYYEFRADLLAEQSAKLRASAADERSGVGKQTKAKQKKLVKLKSTYEALLKELADSGVDVSALLKA